MTASGLRAAADRIDRLNAAIGHGVAWLVLAIVLVQFALVVMRYLFGLGSIWLTESIIYMHAMLFLLAAAWTLREGGHVRVDIFYGGAAPRRKALIDLLGALSLLLPFTLTLLWLSLPYAHRSWAILERSQETSGIPAVFLLKSLIPLFAGLLALQGVAQALRATSSLIPPPFTGKGGRRSPPGGGYSSAAAPPVSSLRSEPPSPEGEG
jgi:TRAP-type mannitol/chloroaromatic compound transport system permease small subunit